MKTSRPRAYFSFIALMAGALLLAGCAGLGKRLETPRINISNIRVQEVKGFESILRIDLRVLNTNDIPIALKGMDCELQVNDRRLASGVSDTKVTIPALGTEIVPITVYSSVLDLFKGILGLKQGQEKLKYRLTGRVRMEAGTLAPSTLPFTSEGELSLDSISR